MARALEEVADPTETGGTAGVDQAMLQVGDLACTCIFKSNLLHGLSLIQFVGS